MNHAIANASPVSSVQLVAEERRAWKDFDAAASRLALREVTFEQFVQLAKADFGRLARKVAREKRLPTWMTIEDVEQGLIAAAWHNFYVRAGGFDAKKYASAGAWLRWKAQNRVRKDISKAKGECQHTRRGPGRPEYLSRTGEHGGIGGLPDLGSAPTEEDAADRAVRFARLYRLCETPRELAVLRSLEVARGDEAEACRLLALADAGGKDLTSPEAEAEAGRTIDEFVKDWTRELGAPATRRRGAAREVSHGRGNSTASDASQ